MKEKINNGISRDQARRLLEYIENVALGHRLLENLINILPEEIQETKEVKQAEELVKRMSTTLSSDIRGMLTYNNKEAKKDV